MTDNNDFFDDLISDELETDEFEMGSDEADDDDDDDNGVPVDLHTVIMAKDDMIALLGLKTSPEGGLIVRVDPRENHPAAQTYDDPAAATKWFRRSLASSKRNGWQVIYDGEPMFG